LKDPATWERERRECASIAAIRLLLRGGMQDEHRAVKEEKGKKAYNKNIF